MNTLSVASSRIVRMLVLANARKYGGHCVAGRVISCGKLGPWMRPVGLRRHGELTAWERCLPGKIEPALLDIIELGVSERRLHPWQPENHLVHAKTAWKLIGKATWVQAQKAIETPTGELWQNGEHSRDGDNDRVRIAAAKGASRSLVLIKPQKLVLAVCEGAITGPERRELQLRADFWLGRDHYRLAVTDPVAEAAYLLRPPSDYPVHDALMCVSLGENYKGYAYKLAASIITPGLRFDEP